MYPPSRCHFYRHSNYCPFRAPYLKIEGARWPSKKFNWLEDSMNDNIANSSGTVYKIYPEHPRTFPSRPSAAALWFQPLSGLCGPCWSRKTWGVWRVWIWVLASQLAFQRDPSRYLAHRLCRRRQLHPPRDYQSAPLDHNHHRLKSITIIIKMRERRWHTAQVRLKIAHPTFRIFCVQSLKAGFAIWNKKL